MAEALEPPTPSTTPFPLHISGPGPTTGATRSPTLSRTDAARCSTWGDSYVVPVWLWPVFSLGIMTYYPKRSYIGVSRHAPSLFGVSFCRPWSCCPVLLPDLCEPSEIQGCHGKFGQGSGASSAFGCFRATGNVSCRFACCARITRQFLPWNHV